MAESAKTPDNDSVPQEEVAQEAAENNVETPKPESSTPDIGAYDAEGVLSDLELGISAANNNREYALEEGITDAAAAEIAKHSNIAKSKLLAIATGSVDHPVFEKVSKMKKAQRKTFLNTVATRFIMNMNAEKARLNRGQRRMVKNANNIGRVIKIAKKFGDVGMDALGSAVGDAYNGLGFYNPSRMHNFLKETDIEGTDGANVKVNVELAKYVDNPDDPVLMAVAQQAVIGELDGNGDFGADKLSKVLSELPRPINADGVDEVTKKNNETISGFVVQIEEMRDLLDKSASVTRGRNKYKNDAESAKQSLETSLSSAESKKADIDTRLNAAEGELDRKKLEARTAPVAPGVLDDVERLKTVVGRLRTEATRAQQEVTNIQAEVRAADKKIVEFDSGSVESTVELEHVRSRLITTVQKFISAVEDNVSQAGNVVKLEDYAALKELKDLVAGLSNQTNSNETAADAATITANLGFDKILKVGREIAKVQLATATRRLFKPEELVIALLQKKYVELGYSPEQAKTMSAIEAVTLQRQNNISDFMEKAKDARENRKGYLKRFYEKNILRKTEFVTYTQALRGMARDQELSQEGAEAFAQLSPKQSFREVRELFKEGKVTKAEITEYMFRLAGLLGPVQIKGTDKYYTLKGVKDVTAIEQIVNNLNRLTAEMSALEVGKEFREQSKLAENKDVDKAELYAKVLKAYNDSQFDNEVALSARASSEAVRSLDTKNKAQKIVRDVMQYAATKTGNGVKRVGGSLVWAGKTAGKVAAAPFKLTAAGVKNLTAFATWVARNPLYAAGRVVSAPIRVVNWGVNKIAIAVGDTLYQVSQLAGRAFVVLPGLALPVVEGFKGGINAAAEGGQAKVMNPNRVKLESRGEAARAFGDGRVQDISHELNREISDITRDSSRRADRRHRAHADWDESFRNGEVANNNVQRDNDDDAQAA